MYSLLYYNCILILTLFRSTASSREFLHHVANKQSIQNSEIEIHAQNSLRSTKTNTQQRADHQNNLKSKIASRLGLYQL